MVEVFELPEQTTALPEILPWIGGRLFIATASILGCDEPQELFALTVRLPPVFPAVAVIEVLVDTPVHPEGSIQL